MALFLASPAAKAASTLDKIDQTQVQGRLTADRAILLKVQALKNPGSLPAEFAPDEPIPERCGTRVTLEAFENWSSYSPSTQNILQAALSRPAQQKSYISPDGFFMFHYDTTGPNAVPLTDLDSSGVPDYIEDFARYADSTYRTEVLQMGYRPPPSDGDGIYDVYTQDLGSGYYGYTQPEEPGPAPWGDYTSFIVVHRNFFGFPLNDDPDGAQKGAMKVTIAHEFHHAIQLAYSANLNTNLWFMEATSTWMEEVVFDPVDDNYQYLPIFFRQPYTPLTDPTIHIYACFIWDLYLADNFGPDIIRQVWEQSISYTSAQSLGRVLQTYSTSLGKEFTRFALWNFYTGSRNDGQHYAEGGFYPMMSLHANTGGPIISGRSRSLLPLAAAYEAFPSSDSLEKAEVIFVGRPTGVWGANLVLSAPPSIRAYPFHLVANNTGDTTLFGVDSFPRVVLIAAQVNTSLFAAFDYFDYTYKAFPPFIRGDLNEDLSVNPLDIVYELNYLFLGTLPPENHLEAADLDCDGEWGPADLVRLSNLIFRAVPPPC